MFCLICIPYKTLWNISEFYCDCKCVDQCRIFPISPDHGHDGRSGRTGIIRNIMTPLHHKQWSRYCQERWWWWGPIICDTPPPPRHLVDPTRFNSSQPRAASPTNSSWLISTANASLSGPCLTFQHIHKIPPSSIKRIKQCSQGLNN